MNIIISHNRFLNLHLCSLNEYGFDVAFDHDSSQTEVYAQTAKPYISSVIEGYNVTVFAYGATGAGKTHTMMGNTRQDESINNSDAGIIPNALVDIFDILSSKKSTAKYGESYSVIVSFMEVYNEQVYDLLEPSGKILSVREDQEKGVVIVAGITEKIVDCPEVVLELLKEGNAHRKTEATMANQVSSRSHAVLQLTVRHTIRSETGHEHATDSKLSLIDLAGSERASATNNRGTRLVEGANINKSLLALANCINALAENSATNKKNNVKYRDSKLTHLLKSSLEGKCKLVMIANINPSHHTFEDSHNTLKYANRAKNIKVNPQLGEQIQKESSWIEREARLREENAILRERVAELEMALETIMCEIGGDMSSSSLTASSISALIKSLKNNNKTFIMANNSCDDSRYYQDDCEYNHQIDSRTSWDGGSNMGDDQEMGHMMDDVIDGQRSSTLSDKSISTIRSVSENKVAMNSIALKEIHHPEIM